MISSVMAIGMVIGLAFVSAVWKCPLFRVRQLGFRGVIFLQHALIHRKEPRSSNNFAIKLLLFGLKLDI